MLAQTNRLPLSVRGGRARPFDSSLDGEFLKVRFSKNGLNHARCAVVISKKVITLATERNRAKRALIGYIEKEIGKKDGYDIYIWIKKKIPKTPKSILGLVTKELAFLLLKIGGTGSRAKRNVPARKL